MLVPTSFCPRKLESSSNFQKRSSFVMLHEGDRKLTSNSNSAEVPDMENSSACDESGEYTLGLPFLGDQGRRKSWQFHHLLKIQQAQLNALHRAQHRLDQIADHKGVPKAEDFNEDFSGSVTSGSRFETACEQYERADNRLDHLRSLTQRNPHEVKDDLLAVLSRTRERYIYQRSKEIQRLLQNIGLDEQIFPAKPISEPKASLNTSESVHRFRHEFPSQICDEGRGLSTEGYNHTAHQGIGQNFEPSNRFSRISKRNHDPSRKAINQELDTTHDLVASRSYPLRSSPFPERAGGVADAVSMLRVIQMSTFMKDSCKHAPGINICQLPLPRRVPLD